jgi:hypothetical protein
MGDTMVASGTEMEGNIDQTFRTFEDKFHIFEPSKSEIQISTP